MLIGREWKFCVVWNNQIKMFNHEIRILLFAFENPLINLSKWSVKGWLTAQLRSRPLRKMLKEKQTRKQAADKPKERSERGVCGGLDAFRPHQELGNLNCAHAHTLTNAERSDRIGTNLKISSTYHVKPSFEALFPELKTQSKISRARVWLSVLSPERWLERVADGVAIEIWGKEGRANPAAR